MTERADPMTTTTADPIHEARALVRRNRRLQTQMDDVNRRRRAIIVELIRDLGLTQTEVARMLDISRQRVTQYVDELRASGELPPSCHDDDAGDSDPT